MNPSDSNIPPEHISTMFNFVGCTNMYIDMKGSRCVVYNKQQPDIKVFIRKFLHNF